MGTLAPVGRRLVVSLERYVRQGEVMVRGDILFNGGTTSIRFGVQTGLNFFQ